jgi:hypothetical protein
MTNDIFRTVRELLQSNKCVLMGNAVNNEGELYDDSVENLTAILAMADGCNGMMAGLEAASGYLATSSYVDRAKWLAVRETVDAAIAKAKGEA